MSLVAFRFGMISDSSAATAIRTVRPIWSRTDLIAASSTWMTCVIDTP